MKVRAFLLLVLFCGLVISVSSQEVLIDLESNYQIEKYVDQYGVPVRNKDLGDTLELPFFDDFSKGTIYPDQNLWLDDFVFINSGFPVDPPTIGVATLDCIDESGMMYSNASTGQFVADFLTSKPINLKNYIKIDTTRYPSNSIYLFDTVFTPYCDSLLWKTDSVYYTVFDSVVLVDSSVSLYWVSDSNLIDTNIVFYYWDPDSTEFLPMHPDSNYYNHNYYRSFGIYYGDSLLWKTDSVYYTVDDSIVLVDSTVSIYWMSDSSTVDSNLIFYFYDTVSLGFLPMDSDSNYYCNNYYLPEVNYMFFSDKLLLKDSNDIYNSLSDNLTLLDSVSAIYWTPSKQVNDSINIYYYNEGDSVYTLIEYLPIEYNLCVHDSIFLSFFYQPGGLGAPPEERDSLVLEFYSPVDSVWSRAWSMTGSAVHDFQQVMLQIVDSAKFYHEGFQFRFKNYGSLADVTLASKSSNNDMWNIDVIYLDYHRGIGDTAIGDIAVIAPLSSQLYNYSSIPWRHYQYYEGDAINSFESLFKNYSSEAEHYDMAYDVVSVEHGVDYTNRPFTTTGAEDIEPYMTETLGGSTSGIFDAGIDTDSIGFDIKVYLKLIGTAFEDYKRWNDTVRHIQIFDDYYAYDDGTPEKGYGLAGSGSENARVACKYINRKPDTLRGVEIFFNRIYHSLNRYFYLTVWSDNNGIPGDIIWQEESRELIFGNNLNEFVRYEFEIPDTAEISQYIIDNNGERVIYFEDTMSFFIGWQKISTEDMLNVGFDRNTIQDDKLYYSYSGSWVESSMEGSLMIRPVFGDEMRVGKNYIPLPQYDVNIFPNPANSTINLKYSDELINICPETLIFDTSGRKVYHSESCSSSISVKDLQSGLYFVRVTDYKDISITRKIIISH